MTLRASDFKVGDKVTVAADAKTANGGSVFFDGQIDAVVYDTPSTAGSVAVGSMGGVHQLVGPQYLTRRFDVGDKVLVAEDAESPLGDWSSLHDSGLKGNVGTVTGLGYDGDSPEGVYVNRHFVFTKYLEPVRDEEETIDDCPFLSLQDECCGRPSECAPEEPERDHFEETGCDCEHEWDEDDVIPDIDFGNVFLRHGDTSVRFAVPRNTLLSAFAVAHRDNGDPADLMALETLLVDFLFALDIEVTD